ncbi:unnamed protein product [Ectocarpus sp. 12 AP-2014]
MPVETRASAAAAVAKSPDAKPPSSGVGSLVVLFIMWYGFNAYYNISNKMVVSTWFFPYTCAFLQTVIGLVYLIPMWASGMQKVPKLTMEDVIKLLPISILHAGGHLAAVLSMSAGAVSFTHIIKASEPVASTVIGPFFGVEVQPMTVNMFLLPIVGGVAYAAMKPGQGLDMSQLTNLASGYAMASNIFFAIRGILSKQVMTPEYKETKNMSASNTYGVLTIMSSVILILPMLFFEGLASKDAFDDVNDKATLLKTLLGCGISYYLYNEMGFRVLNRLDPVSSAVGNTVKRVVIMGAAVLFLGEEMNANKLIGACIAVAGTLAYSLAKNSAAAAKKAKAA